MIYKRYLWLNQTLKSLFCLPFWFVKMFCVLMNNVVPAFWTFDEKITGCGEIRRKIIVNVIICCKNSRWHFTFLHTRYCKEKCVDLPFNLCLLWKYWHVKTRENKKMDSRPSEQINTTHKYTSDSETKKYFQGYSWLKVIWRSRDLRHYLQIKPRAPHCCHPQE